MTGARRGGGAAAGGGAGRVVGAAPQRPSPVLVAVFGAGALMLAGAVAAAAVSAGAWPWPVVTVLWVAFVGLRHDAAQRWTAGGDLGRRTAPRVLVGQLLGSLALVSCALPGLVPLVCLLVAAVHAEWRWRRALEAGALGGIVLSAGAGAGTGAGLLTAVHGPVQQVAAAGLASMVLANVALLARQRERADAALAAEQRARHSELLHAARHDALTGLLGRRGTAEVLGAACATAAPGSLAAVVFCDLDGFKPVNDLHGHDVGDQALVAVADRLRAAAGPSAQVGRTGGDEFVVVLSHAAHAAAVEAVAQHVSRCLDEPLAVGGLVLPLGVSTGAAWCDAPGPAEELVRRADAAMYGVKVRRRTAGSAARAVVVP